MPKIGFILSHIVRYKFETYQEVLYAMWESSCRLDLGNRSSPGRLTVRGIVGAAFLVVVRFAWPFFRSLRTARSTDISL